MQTEHANKHVTIQDVNQALSNRTTLKSRLSESETLSLIVKLPLGELVNPEQYYKLKGSLLLLLKVDSHFLSLQPGPALEIHWANGMKQK